MKLKKVLGCLLGLGILLSPMAVCAEENTDIVAYTQDQQSFASIEEAWNVACQGTLVYLNEDWNLDSRLTVGSGQNVTLDLNGHAIRRQLSATESDGEVIYMNENSNLTLKGSTENTFTIKDWKNGTKEDDKKIDVTTGGIITGGYSKNGAGGIHMKANSVLNLDHVGVVGNASKSSWAAYGGGIKLDGDSCTLNINNGSIVSYNYAELGGGIYINGQEAHVNVSASEISNNCAKSRGGGMYSNCDATYIELNNNATIKENKAGGYGGGIFFFNSYNHTNSKDGTGEISSNYVEGTEVENSHKVAQGGGVYYGDVSLKKNTATITNITFENNSLNPTIDYSLGGAIYCDLGNVEMTNCTFKNNTAVYGGAIYDNDKGNAIKDCTIKNNNAKQDGGAVYVDSRYDLKISGKCIIKDNTKGDAETVSNIYLQNGNFTRAYVSGTPSAGSEVGLSGDGDCKVGIDQSENNGTFFVDDSNSYHLEYDDGKLYQKNGATGSIFGSGNTIVAVVVLVCVITVGFIVYRKKRGKYEA